MEAIVSGSRPWEEYLSAHRQRHLDELFEFLTIPSVSALPEHRPDIRRAAEWVAAKLGQAGVPKVEIMETSGNPVVFGEWAVDDSKPTALIYGHYDVQPPDPLELWQTPPFEPAIRGDRIYARGAADDKGNLFMPIKAVEALHVTQGGPPINLKFIFEGEEEIGSPSLPEFVNGNTDLLACDFVICADGGMWGPDTPSLTLGTKGIAGCQVDIRTADTDLHSGMFGASVQNAVRAAAQLAATLHDADQRVAVAGFYDDVLPLTGDEREAFGEAPFDAERYLADIGAAAFVGEAGYSPVELNWARPTLDLNGIWGGFTGPGTKTVTPSEAHFKITCRLVPNQDPNRIIDLVEKHLLEHAPPGATVIVNRETTGGSKAFRVGREHPAIQAAFEVLGDLYDRDPYYVRLGGTLPIAATFQDALDADMIFYSWGMPDSRAHAPNENFQLKSFDMARRGHCALLERLGSVQM
jgi:acetylornithine deacetylase/succinyl-diaminopimelate desuccinylase-like protein